ncbi:PfkB family carbohydrate kinase [Nocardioides sp. SYSU D00038]|uniref:PfkB family carbohydrate kinase n=1 Tax=Nocardioides sp. SYSU D00038 TaxID=2812554 RepID=UPI001F072DC7|nr:PfkB family carbohydrate kinase [Nocardioides sp. SYSU D00038]
MTDDVLVVGEALVDVVVRADGTRVEHPGGSAANVAVALGRLGRGVRFASAWADDRYGALLVEHLAGSGVVLAGDPHVLARTSSAEATIAADGSASYVFDFDWRLGPVPREPAPLAVHTSSVAAVLAPGADDVRALLGDLRATSTVTYDVNARPAVTGAGPEVVAGVEQVAALADVVKASDEDLRTLWPGGTVREAADRLLSLGPAAVVVTLGEGGAEWLDAARSVRVASQRVEVADTIGAGDTFGAGLLDALWSRGRLGAGSRAALRELPQDEVRDVLAHAAAAAAVTVSRPGADPPWRHEL